MNPLLANTDKMRFTFSNRKRQLIRFDMNKFGFDTKNVFLSSEVAVKLEAG
jgi:hypothetical protein